MGGDKISIFKFDNYIDFLKVAAQPKEGVSDEASTLEGWAKQLGYRSPSSLSMVLNGQRLPSQEMVEAISRNLRLKPLDKEYFLLLIKLERLKRQGKDTAPVLEEIYRMNNMRPNAFHVTHQQFSYIADWYHFAIKQLISTPDFREDYDWIHKRLRKKVSPAKIREAIENLIKLGIASRDENGKLQVTGKGIETPNDEVVSTALRKHHKGMIQRALEAIEEQPLEGRYLNAITLKLDKDKIPEAKEVITRFIHEFGKQFSTKDSKNVYQLNIQLFEHTSDAATNLPESSEATPAGHTFGEEK